MLFTIIHVPLYLLLFWGLFSPDGAINQAVVTGFDVFCLVHVVLHLLFVRHPRYRFNNWFSWTLILGAGLAGGADLLLRL
jgi:multisubunit Na+/H+ antiporter MnhB subunit